MEGFKTVVSSFCLVALLFSCANAELTEEMKELMAMLHKTCVEETGVQDALITGTMQGNFPEDPALKCYMKCILVQGAGMDEEGIIDVEAIIAMLPEEMQEDVPATMRKCGTQTGVDHCDTAFKTNKCWYDNCPKKYFLI